MVKYMVLYENPSYLFDLFRDFVFSCNIPVLKIQINTSANAFVPIAVTKKKKAEQFMSRPSYSQAIS